MSEQFRAFAIARAVLWGVILSAALFLHRAQAQDAPAVAFGASNVADLLSIVRGGARRGTRLLDKLDVTATLKRDDGPLAGWSAFIDVQATDGTQFNDDLAGTVQGISNIDAPAGARLLDAWVSRDIEGRAGVKAGILDLNSEFDVQQTGALFLNPSHGIGPDVSQSGANGPSIFPSTGLGAAAWWLPGEHWQFKAGLFEGVTGDPNHPGRESVSIDGREGALLVFETRNRITPDFVLGAGIWSYTASFTALDGSNAHGNAGVYAIADGKLTGEDDKGLRGWLRAGLANGRINPVDAYLGGGLVYTGILADSDQAGVAIGGVHLATLAQTSGSHETTVEGTYAVIVHDGITLQPDIQYVFAPGADPAKDDALILGTRLTFNWN